MSVEKDVLLTQLEKEELYCLLQKYEMAKRDIDNHLGNEEYDKKRREVFIQAKRILEEFLLVHGFHLRFPGREEIYEFDLKTIAGMFVNDKDINKKEIYVLAEDKTILERAVTSIESIVNQYQSYTPWMDEDVGEVGQIKDLIGKISQYVDKLSVIDETSADIYLYTYFKHNCHKFSL